jgi:hypothetical protein
MRTLRKSHIVVESSATDETWVQVSNKHSHERHWEHHKFDRMPVIVYPFGDEDFMQENIRRNDPRLETAHDDIVAFAENWWSTTDADGTTMREMYQADLNIAVRAAIRRLEATYNEHFAGDFAAFMATIEVKE